MADLGESFFLAASFLLGNLLGFELSDELNLAASSFVRDTVFFFGGRGELFFLPGETGEFVFFFGETGRVAFFPVTNGGLDLTEMVDPTPRVLPGFFCAEIR